MSILRSKMGGLSLSRLRLLGVLPILEDEDGIATLPREKQSQPLHFEIDAWDGYLVDYNILIESGFIAPEMVFQVLWDDKPVGSPVSKVMPADPADPSVFPVVLQVPAEYLGGEGVFGVRYELWFKDVENEVRSSTVHVRIDRTAPNQGDKLLLSGPGTINAAHLLGNNGSALFTLKTWPDIRLEDSVHLYFQKFEDVTLPPEAIQMFSVNSANKSQSPFELLLDESLLRKGRYRVFCHLYDRSGNINRWSNVLDVNVEVSGLFAPVEDIQPYVSLFGWINCESLKHAAAQPGSEQEVERRGLKFRVPLPQTGLEVGDRVQLSWQLCSDTVGAFPVDTEPDYLPRTPVAITADGYLFMNRINELIIEKLSDYSPMEASVRVGYRVERTPGRWRASEYSIFGISLEKPGNPPAVCNGRWPDTFKSISKNKPT